MKIAYFNGSFKKGDGVTHVLLELTKEVQKRGVESIIITSYAEDKSISPVPIIQVPSIVFPLYKEYKLALPGIRGFEKALNKFQPDIIHIHSPDTIGWAALKYAKKYKIPIVATYHTDFSRYLPYYHLSFLRPLLWFMLKRLYKQMSFVTTMSQVVGKELTNHGISNILIIPWGVDFRRFNTSFRSLEWRQKILKKNNGLIILYAGRLTWEKDLKTLADTYKLLENKYNDFVIVVAGDGPNRKELELLMPGAIFLGNIEEVELSETFASSDIFLFPSSTETFGNVTIEAMASGLVPVVADAGGSKSLVKEGENGFLAQPKNAEDFFKKVHLLLNNRQLREQMQNACLDFVKDYSWEKIFDNFLQKYLKLLDK